MGRIPVGQQSSEAIEIYYKDYSTGQPAMLVHPCLLNGHCREMHERVPLQAGYRVITYDRRGFGQFSQPTTAWPG
jgi:non-heme chloroperoxidase